MRRASAQTDIPVLGSSAVPKTQYDSEVDLIENMYGEHTGSTYRVNMMVVERARPKRMTETRMRHSVCSVGQRARAQVM